MKIYIGADHRGFALKSKIIKYLQREGYDVEDVGDKILDPDDDFPLYASHVAARVLSSEDKDPRGILLCGSGQGVAMAANRFRGIRAAVCWDKNSAKEARNDDDSNVLCMPANDFDEKQTEKIIDCWLKTNFAAAPRFIRRLKQIDNL